MSAFPNPLDLTAISACLTPFRPYPSVPRPSPTPPGHQLLEPNVAHTSLYTGRVKDSTWRQVLDTYLGIGENIFAFCCGFAVSSSYFRRQID